MELGSLSGVLPPLPKFEVRIWTGHQAEFWHPGILAKYIAAAAIAERVRAAGGRASVTWLVVDQDANEPWKISYPAVVDGNLVKAVWNVPVAGGATASSGTFSADTPTCALPVLSAGPVPKNAHAAAAEGLESIRSALLRHQGESNAARQVAKSLCDLLVPWCKPDDVVYASELWRGRAFAGFVDLMRSDPAGCVAAYNRAVAQVPEARVRPLGVEGNRVELPLWRMPRGFGGARRVVWSDGLASLKLEELAPRALAMTAAVRLGASDLFIHGTSGGVYDRITELWVADWITKGGSQAATGVVTATRHLPFDVKVRTPEEIARARWKAHAARHSPGVLGDEAGERTRRELVNSVKTARARGESPRAAFAALHAFLAQERAQHAGRIEQVNQAAAEAAGDSDVARVVYERAWPFPLYPRGVLDELAREVRAGADVAVQKKA